MGCWLLDKKFLKTQHKEWYERQINKNEVRDDCCSDRGSCCDMHEECNMGPPVKEQQKSGEHSHPCHETKPHCHRKSPDNSQKGEIHYCEEEKDDGECNRNQGSEQCMEDCQLCKDECEDCQLEQLDLSFGPDESKRSNQNPTELKSQRKSDKSKQIDDVTESHDQKYTGTYNQVTPIK